MFSFGAISRVKSTALRRRHWSQEHAGGEVTSRVIAKDKLDSVFFIYGLTRSITVESGRPLGGEVAPSSTRETTIAVQLVRPSILQVFVKEKANALSPLLTVTREDAFGCLASSPSFEAFQDAFFLNSEFLGYCEVPYLKSNGFELH